MFEIKMRINNKKIGLKKEEKVMVEKFRLKKCGSINFDNLKKAFGEFLKK